MSQLIRALGPHFLDRALACEFTKGELDPVSALSDIASWDDLNAALTSHRLTAPRVRLHLKAGDVVPEDEYTLSRSTRRDELYRTLDLPKVIEFLRGGASLVIDAIDELLDGVRHAAAELEWTVCEPVQVNAYVTWGTESGFGPHWDDHDVLILQVTGSKHWTVYGPSRKKPMYSDVQHDIEPPEDVLWDGLLRAGDIVHIPRGFWHNVRGIGNGSFHLTFGFTRRTNIDAILHRVESLREFESLRTDIDRFGGDFASYDAAVAAVIQALKDSSPRDYLQLRDAELAARRRLSLPFEVDSELPTGSYKIEVLSRVPFILEEQDEKVVVKFDGKGYRLPILVRPTLQLLKSKRVVSSEELRAESGLSEDDFNKLIRTLVRWRIAAVIRD